MRFEKVGVVINLARLLAASAEGMTLDEIALALDVSRRTAERLKAIVEDVFPQLESRPDGHRLRFRITGGLNGFFHSPTSDELAELHAASLALQTAGCAERADLLVSLATKIKRALRGTEQRRLAPDIEALTTAIGYIPQVGPQPRVDRDTFECIRTALKGGNMLSFLYGENKTWRRKVSPWGILYGHAYYLVGPVTGKRKPVLWRFDKIIDIQIAGRASLPPTGWSVEAFVSQAFGVFQEKPERIILRFNAGVAQDAGRFLFHPAQKLKKQADGSLVVEFESGGAVEIAHHLFTWGTSVEIIEPASLKKRLCDMLTDVLKHHQKY
ncbi:hypothetical protein HK15_01400 [Acetobacter orientalis]|uniref:Uncharacterized protein n=1 Tax=Acetobacter orientalis TaxID=146474 RepID=A0A252B088_9PROT|nr:WYL domain-containing protein [Acetobacter orientalis]OUI97697.1 hypothetical protein HK15_01400 [Acetobacter orientalis]